MANLLNRLLQDSCFHILIKFLLLVLLCIQIGVDTCELHFLLRGGTRRIFCDLLNDFEHTLEWGQDKLGRRVTEVNSSDCQHDAHPYRPANIDRCFRFNLSFETINNVEFYTVRRRR